MDEKLLNQILLTLQEHSKDQAVLVSTVEKIDKNIEGLNEAMNGTAATTGLLTKVALLENKVEKLETLKEKVEDFERDEQHHKRNRWLTGVGLAISSTLAIISIIISTI